MTFNLIFNIYINVHNFLIRKLTMSKKVIQFKRQHAKSIRWNCKKKINIGWSKILLLIINISQILTSNKIINNSAKTAHHSMSSSCWDIGLAYDSNSPRGKISLLVHIHLWQGTINMVGMHIAVNYTYLPFVTLMLCYIFHQHRSFYFLPDSLLAFTLILIYHLPTVNFALFCCFLLRLWTIETMFMDQYLINNFKEFPYQYKNWCSSSNFLKFLYNK